MFPKFSLHKRFIITRETSSANESAFHAFAMRNDNIKSLHLFSDSLLKASMLIVLFALILIFLSFLLLVENENKSQLKKFQAQINWHH